MRLFTSASSRSVSRERYSSSGLSSHDSGAWETLAQLTADGRRCFDVPFVPRRCGSLRFRLKGRGQLTLRSLTRTSAAARGGILAQEVN